MGAYQGLGYLYHVENMHLNEIQNLHVTKNNRYMYFNLRTVTTIALIVHIEHYAR